MYNKDKNNGFEEAKLVHLSEVDLVERAKRGSHLAFSELMRRYQDKIFNAIYRHTDDWEASAEITQRAFINVYKAIRDFRGDSTFLTWLHKIAFNESISYKREQIKVKMFSFYDNYGEDGEMLTREPTDYGRNPEEKFEAKEDSEKIQEAINQLNEISRKVIILKDIEGLSYKEVSDILGITVGVVRNKLHEARLELKKKLKHLITTSL